MKKFATLTALTLALALAASSALAADLKPGMNKVSFQSEGVNMVGNLFLPSSYQAGSKLPAVVVTGTWTSVKEMMANTYARKLSEQGYAAFTFDFRNFGESGGTPRQYESPALKIQDIKSAVSFVKTLSAVDRSRVGGLAVCASAGYMAQAQADGAGLNSFVTVAAWMHDAAIAEAIYGGKEGVAQKIAASRTARAAAQSGAAVQYVPAYSTTDSSAAMFGEFDYYGNPRRGAIAQWTNRFAVQSWEGWLTNNAIPSAAKITVPTLVIHSDNAATADGVRAFYNGLPVANRSMYWTQEGHFDFYDNDAVVTRSVRVAGAHFDQTLKNSAPGAR